MKFIMFTFHCVKKVDKKRKFICIYNEKRWLSQKKKKSYWLDNIIHPNNYNNCDSRFFNKLSSNLCLQTYCPSKNKTGISYLYNCFKCSFPGAVISTNSNWYCWSNFNLRSCFMWSQSKQWSFFVYIVNFGGFECEWDLIKFNFFLI